MYVCARVFISNIKYEWCYITIVSFLFLEHLSLMGLTLDAWQSKEAGLD